MAGIYQDHRSAQQTDHCLYDHHIFHGSVAGLHFAKVICRADAKYYTVSIGLWKMLEKEYIDGWYTCFAAGAVIVSIPIAILFLATQKFYVDGMSGAVKG